MLRTRNGQEIALTLFPHSPTKDLLPSPAKASIESRRRSFHFCLVISALCLLTYFSYPSTTGPFPNAAQAPLTTSKPASADDLVLKSVVQLISVGPGEKEQNRECAASGFLIDEEGYLITAAHVVDDARRCLSKAPGAKILAKLTISDSRTAPAVPCDVIGIDAANDLALLKTERPLHAKPGDGPPYAKLDGC